MAKKLNYIIPPLVAVTDRLIPRYFPNPPTEKSDTALRKSYLGTPVYSTLEFMQIPGSQTANSQSVSPSEVLLRIDTVILTVEQTKNIVKTSIQGRDGTIKEYIGLGDYIVSIEGEIVSPYLNFYPEDDVKLLVQVLEHPNRVDVANQFLLMFGITSLVIETYSISEKLGSRNSVPFRVNAISDANEEIYVTLGPNDVP